MKKLKNYKLINKIDEFILIRCKKAINKIDPFAKLVLYGSRARGNATSESDYDLLILTDNPASLEREDIFRREIYPIELETGAVLTVILVNKKDWDSQVYNAMPFHQNVEKDGIIL
ncbi:MAG: nucleotidyltransferase domain-containing protein [Candidatus Schekmanbacteria bacterium]|nr:nucleotidyltransferase domain-containing protein [Candidatus Schekmanbacteria bacterium]